MGVTVSFATLGLGDNAEPRVKLLQTLELKWNLRHIFNLVQYSSTIVFPKRIIPLYLTSRYLGCERA